MIDAFESIRGYFKEGKTRSFMDYMSTKEKNFIVMLTERVSCICEECKAWLKRYSWEDGYTVKANSSTLIWEGGILPNFYGQVISNVS